MNTNNNLIENVIVTSDEPWNDIWHTQLHYAFQLSKRFNVIFVDPPMPWKISNLFSFKTELKLVSPGLRVFRYLNVFPSAAGKLAIRLNDRINQMLIQKLIPELRRNSNLLVWHFDPFRSHFIFRNFNQAKHIYHVVDPIVGYHLDKEMALEADLVIVTSPKFLDHYHSLNKNVIRIGQGVDLGFFRHQYNVTELESQVSYDSILLLGTFSDEIDYRFLHKLAGRYPGKLVLIGPDKTSESEARTSLKMLRSTKGVTWLGPMNPVAFHKHLAACRIGIITYTYSNYERNNLRSPLKIISYLACGKSIISNIDCEVPTLVNKAIYIVNNDEDYFKLLDESYANRLAFDADAVAKFLSKIDYDKLLSDIFLKLKETLPSIRQ